MAADVTYVNVERNEEAVESHIYELPDIHFSERYKLPEILPPEPKKDQSPWSPEVVKDKKRQGDITLISSSLSLLRSPCC